MSDRQQRRQRKARRRRTKLLSRSYNLRGMTVHLQEFDYGHAFTTMLQRDSDGARCAVVCHADRLWRHMECVPDRMIGKLVAWFDAQDKHKRPND